MLEYDSPRVQRSITPSPLRATLIHSRKELSDMYSNNPPHFLLNAFDEVSDTCTPSELPKHFLCDFPFRVVNGHLDPTSAQMSKIIRYFPGCVGVAYAPPYLVVKWPKEQVKPWPLTVGGLPLYYATPNQPYPPTFAKPGRSAQIMKGVEERLKPWESPANSFIEKIARMLVEKGIGLKLFGWCGIRWYAEVMSAADGLNIPSTICGLLVTWKVFSGFEESAQRSIIPREHVIDNTSYKPSLRPGVLLESLGGIGTTSGVPLKGLDGKQYFTVARHDFFKSHCDQEVHHPSCVDGANLIGHVQKEDIFPGSNIGFTKLGDGMTYSTISFDDEETDGTNLKGFVSSENLSIGEILFMDSPYNGQCEGLLVWRGVDVVDLVDPEHPDFIFVHMNMIFFGNGMNDIIPGSCGSAIWNNENKVGAFFRWYDPVDAIAYAPSVDMLIEAGYVLEAIP